MINRAELRGDIQPGDTLIEATSGNTGIALAMAAAIKGYRMILIMPDNSSAERKAAMTAYGAELILVTKEQGMKAPATWRCRCRPRGAARCSISSPTATTRKPTTAAPARRSGSRPLAVSPISSARWAPPAPSWACPATQGAEPGGADRRLAADGRRGDPGIRRWPQEYLPKIYQAERVDRVVDMSQDEAEQTMRRLAREEASSAVCPPAARWPRLCVCRRRWRTR